MTEPSTTSPSFVQPSLSQTPLSWKWLIADGALGIITGIFAISFPGITVLALAFLLGFGLMIQGSVEIGVGLNAAKSTRGRAGLIAFGVLTALAGIICVVHPGTGLLALILGLALWFALAGVKDLTMAQTDQGHRAFNIVLGVLCLIAAVMLLAQPGLALSTVALIAGITFILRGALNIAAGWALRPVA